MILLFIIQGRKTVEEYLQRIRIKSNIGPTPAARILHLFYVVLLGAGAGTAVKLFDLLPYLQNWGAFPGLLFDGLYRVGNMYSVWILAGSLMAVFSHRPLFSGIYCFFFFFSMDVAYYIVQTGYYRLPTSKYFVFWMAAAAVSVVPGIVMWYARGGGIAAALLAALPVGSILGESLFSLFPLIEQLRRGNFVSAVSFLIPLLFCMAAAAMLLVLLPQNRRQRLYQAAFALPIIPAAYLLLKVFGGGH